MEWRQDVMMYEGQTERQEVGPFSAEYIPSLVVKNVTPKHKNIEWQFKRTIFGHKIVTSMHRRFCYRIKRWRSCLPRRQLPVWLSVQITAAVTSAPPCRDKAQIGRQERKSTSTAPECCLLIIRWILFIIDNNNKKKKKKQWKQLDFFMRDALTCIREPTRYTHH
jgi:hypothetical protein